MHTLNAERRTRGFDFTPTAPALRCLRLDHRLLSFWHRWFSGYVTATNKSTGLYRSKSSYEKPSGTGKAVTQLGKHRTAIFLASEDDTDLGAVGTSPGATAAGRDFAVLRWQREDTGAGNLQAIGWLGTIVQHPDRRAITQDIDVHWDSVDSKWNLDGELMHSSIEGTDGVGFAATAKYVPRPGDLYLLNTWGYDNRIDLNDLGFLNRNDNVGLFFEF